MKSLRLNIYLYVYYDIEINRNRLLKITTTFRPYIWDNVMWL